MLHCTPGPWHPWHNAGLPHTLPHSATHSATHCYTHELLLSPQVYETGQLVHEEDGSASALAAVVAEPPADFTSALYEPGGGAGLLPGSEARGMLEMENSARWGDDAGVLAVACW
jgi:hypothetical protein